MHACAMSLYVWDASIPAAAESVKVLSNAFLPFPLLAVARAANLKTSPSSLDRRELPRPGGTPPKSASRILSGCVQSYGLLPIPSAGLGVGAFFGSKG